MLLALLLVAAEEGSKSLPELPPVAQYGLLGAGFAALASGRFLVPRYVLDRERDRADRMEAENQRLNTLIQEKAIPAIVDASNAVQESSRLIHDLQREREIQREVDRKRGES